MRAAYDGIYFDIKRSILDGLYCYKDFLPSESTLIKQYGCAHNTVRKAIEILAREGYVQPVHGKGVRVIYRSTPIISEQTPILTPYGIESSRNVAQLIGRKTCARVLLMESVEAQGTFCVETGFDKGEKLLHMERIRSYDGRYLVREENYFRADMVAGITKDDAERSVYDYIELVQGKKIVTCKRIVTIERATEADKATLDLNDVDYIAALDVATYDGDGLLCEITRAHYHPDIFTMLQVTTRTRVNHATE